MFSSVENIASSELAELKALYDNSLISLEDIYKIKNAYSHQFIQELIETREAGCQLLHLAVKNNDEKLVQAILDKKPEYVWSFNDAKKSTLAVAAEAGFWNILERLHMVNLQVMTNPFLRTCSKKIAYSSLNVWPEELQFIEWKIKAYRLYNAQISNEKPAECFPPHYAIAYRDVLKAIPLKDMQERDLFLKIFSSTSSLMKDILVVYEREYDPNPENRRLLGNICHDAIKHAANAVSLNDQQQLDFFMKILQQYLTCMVITGFEDEKASYFNDVFKLAIKSIDWKDLAFIEYVISQLSGFFDIYKCKSIEPPYRALLERGIETINWYDETHVNFLMKKVFDDKCPLIPLDLMPILQATMERTIKAINWEKPENIRFFMLHLSRLIKLSSKHHNFDYEPATDLALLAKSSKLVAMLDAAHIWGKYYTISDDHKKVYEEGVRISKANTALWAKPEDSRKPWIPALLVQAFSCKKSAFFNQPVVIYCILKFLAEGQIMDMSDGLTIANNTNGFFNNLRPTKPIRIVRMADGKIINKIEALTKFLRFMKECKPEQSLEWVKLVKDLNKFLDNQVNLGKKVDQKIDLFITGEFKAGRFQETPTIQCLHYWGLINIDTYRYEYTAKATNLFHQEIKTIRKITPESSTLVENLLKIDNMVGKKNAYKHQYKNKYICQYLHKRAVDMKQDASSDTVRLLEKYFAWTPEKRQMFKPVQNIAQMCNEFAGYWNTNLESRVFIQELQLINQNFKWFNTGKTHTRVKEHIDSYLSRKKQQEVLGQPSKLLDVLKKYALVTDEYIQKFQNNKLEQTNLRDFTPM